MMDAPQALPEVPRLPHAPPLGRPLEAQEAPVCVCVHMCGVYMVDQPQPEPEAKPAAGASLSKYTNITRPSSSLHLQAEQDFDALRRNHHGHLREAPRDVGAREHGLAPKLCVDGVWVWWFGSCHAFECRDRSHPPPRVTDRNALISFFWGSHNTPAGPGGPSRSSQTGGCSCPRRR